MKAVLQRCAAASVAVGGEVVGEIKAGLVVFVGLEQTDTTREAAWMADKIAGLRIFDDAEGRFNLSLKETGGQALVISNFTICGETRKGTRPSFSRAMDAQLAGELYQGFAKLLADRGIVVRTGRFGAHMDIVVHNDGPVTILLETRHTNP